jgi:DNA-binding beta-propeller fold protein YncE
MAVNPAGTRLYGVNSSGTSNTVAMFTLDASGKIVGPAPPPTFATGGTRPNDVAVNPAGTRLYVANTASGDVAVLSLDGSGAIVGAPSLVAVGGTSISDLAVSPDGSRLYVPNSSGVTVFVLNASGDITGTQPGSPFAISTCCPTGVAVR